jgi:hypothetical protein
MKKNLFIFIGILWLSAVATGIFLMSQYAGTAGKAAAAPTDWPAESAIKREARKMTLVMIAHPRCPCTRASIEELSRLMTQVQGKLEAYVIFIKPEGLPVDWEKTDSWRNATAIPGVTVMVDNNGVEAERFQAATSGQNLLYDQDGKLVFSGGITIFRGHEGDNDGRSAIAAIANGEEAPKNETPVYGCPLFAEGDERAATEVSK